MATAHDVAKYILSSRGPMPHLKLQKLAYYAQAWSLVWDDAPLFTNRIEAWANGPVVRDLYRNLRLKYTVTSDDIPEGNAEALSEEQRQTVDAVLEYYGDKSSQWLSDLTHMESPWQDARGTSPPGAAGNTEITRAAMADYYSSL